TDSSQTLHITPCRSQYTVYHISEYYLDGSRVKISCNYTVKSDSLLWYRQYSGSGLQFLYLVTTTNNPYEVRGDPQDFRLTVTQNKERTHVDLEISSAEVTDSALYYCALRPTVTGNPETLLNSPVDTTAH
uniref:Ig-like domain-containing protein n=1 Tax=Oncorhynchus kisutch TaxID=8019 RepID=A0A8C7MJD8_ONCKI